MPWEFGQGGLARDIFWMHRNGVRGVLSHGQPVREHLFRAQTGKASRPAVCDPLQFILSDRGKEIAGSDGQSVRQCTLRVGRSS